MTEKKKLPPLFVQPIEQQVIEAMLENIVDYDAQDRMKAMVAEFLSNNDLSEYDDDGIIYAFKEYYYAIEGIFLP